MAQDHELIGRVAPAADAIFNEKKGWQGHTPEDLVDQRTDQDFSFWNARANRQELGEVVPNFQSHEETPVAAVDPAPFDMYGGGIIQP